MTMLLRGYQNRHLRGLAHSLKPSVLIGQKGLAAGAVESINDALSRHELIKIKFIGLEDRSDKRELLRHIQDACGCAVAGMTGHVAILYRPHKDPDKRLIRIPERPSPGTSDS